MSFALPPLRLPFGNFRALDRRPPVVQPTPDPVVQASALDETSRPVPASFRDLTIPDVVPLQRRWWRRPPRIRGRAS
jgi:hypothetical protein